MYITQHLNLGKVPCILVYTSQEHLGQTLTPDAIVSLKRLEREQSPVMHLPPPVTDLERAIMSLHLTAIESGPQFNGIFTRVKAIINDMAFARHVVDGFFDSGEEPIDLCACFNDYKVQCCVGPFQIKQLRAVQVGKTRHRRSTDSS